MTLAQPRDIEGDLVDMMTSFRHDPLSWVRYSFPWGEPNTELAHESGPRVWQAGQLGLMADRLKADDIDGAIRIATSSGHGIGKSALVAWIILWGLSTAPNTRIVVTANTGDQLRTKTWPEVSKWFNLMINRHWFKLEATSISRRTASGAREWRCDAATWSENNTVAFQGLHNLGKRLILIFDEASEIADKIWEVAEGALTDENTEILWTVFGNPTTNTGRFRECFPGGRFAHRWHARQIDSRNVPGTNRAEFDKWIADYGEDSDFVRVRVKGQFPRGGSLQFIDSETVADAAAREAQCHLRQALVMGVDVARFGDDQQVIMFRRGLDARTIAPLKYRGLDLVAFSGRIAEAAREHDAQAVYIDEGGMGAGVVDMVRQMLRGTLVLGINFGARPDSAMLGEDARVSDKASEMWAVMRAWLRTGAIPNDPELIAELTGRQYGFDVHSAIRLERKADMKKRGLSSPDNADALALTFAQAVSDLPADAVLPTRYGQQHDGRSGGYGRHQSEYDVFAEFNDRRFH